MTNSFQPLKAPSMLEELDRNYKTQKESIKQFNLQADADDNVRLQNLVEQNKAAQDTYSQLADFSQTMSKTIVDIKTKQNKRQMAQGLLSRMQEGPDEDAIAKVNAEEAVLIDQSRQTNIVSDKIEAEDGHGLIARKVRNTDPWFQYGRYVGDIQQQVNMLPSMIATAQADDGLSVSINGQPTTYAELDSNEDFMAWQQEFTTQFLERFPGINPAVAEKYIFKDLNKRLSTQAVSWATGKATADKKERVDAAKDRFFQAVQGENAGEVYLDLLRTKALDRDQMETLLNELINDRTIGLNEIDKLRNHEYYHVGKRQRVRLGKEHARTFDQLEQKAKDAQFQQDSNRRKERKAAAERLEQEFEQSLINREKDYTPDEIDAFIKHGISQGLTRSDMPFLTSYITRVSSDQIEEDRLAIIELRHARGNVLLQEDLRNVHPKVRAEFLPQVTGDNDFSQVSADQITNAKVQITASIDKSFDEVEGRTNLPANGEHRAKIDRLALRDYKRLYRKYMTPGGGHTPFSAEEQALQDVSKNIADGVYRKESTSLEEIQSRAKDFDDAKTHLKNNPDAWREQRLMGTSKALPGLKKYAEKGVGQIPSIYFDIAAQFPNVTGWDIANAQSMVAGYGSLYKEKVEEGIDLLDPGVQRMLRYRNTPARTYQASVATGDQKWFLDSIASVESSSYGEYDAYNRGGSNDGYTAIGSGNSSEGPGRLSQPISTMTLGQIMNLQSLPLHHPDGLHAVGRYQFIGPTFRETFINTGLSEDTVFDAATQDLFAMTRARQRISWPGQNSRAGLVSEWRGLKYLFQRNPEAAQRMLQIIQNEPMLQPSNLTAGVTD